MDSFYSNYWWLAFMDEALPRRTQFLGAVVVGPAPTLKAAIALGCKINPEVGIDTLPMRGRCLGRQIPNIILAQIPDPMRGRWLPREEAREFMDRTRRQHFSN